MENKLEKLIKIENIKLLPFSSFYWQEKEVGDTPIKYLFTNSKRVYSRKYLNEMFYKNIIRI